MSLSGRYRLSLLAFTLLAPLAVPVAARAQSATVRSATILERALELNPRPSQIAALTAAVLGRDPQIYGELLSEPAAGQVQAILDSVLPAEEAGQVYRDLYYLNELTPCSVVKNPDALGRLMRTVRSWTAIGPARLVGAPQYYPYIRGPLVSVAVVKKGNAVMVPGKPAREGSFDMASLSPLAKEASIVGMWKGTVTHEHADVEPYSTQNRETRLFMTLPVEQMEALRHWAYVQQAEVVVLRDGFPVTVWLEADNRAPINFTVPIDVLTLDQTSLEQAVRDRLPGVAIRSIKMDLTP